MANITALTGSILTGTTTFGPFTPVLGTTTVQVALDRTGLALTLQPISWALELSLDAAATWIPWGGGGAPGGQIVVSLVVQAESTSLVRLPAPADANTRLRGSITTLEPITSTVTLRMS